MPKTKSLLTAVLAAAVLPATTHAETPSGHVEFTGTPPAMEKLDRSADAFCAKTPAMDESVGG